MTAIERPVIWPDALEPELWAKSAAKGADGAPESLAQHTWLVLDRLADFIKLRPELPIRLGRPSLWNCLYWATFLHDFGKAMPAFQRLLRGDRTARDEWGGHRHELFSLAFVDWLAPGLSDDDLTWIAAAIISHHRDREEMSRLYPTPEPGETDSLIEPLTRLPASHVSGLYDWLTSCGWPWARHLGLDALGVTSIAFPTGMPSFHAVEAARRIRHWLRQYNRLARQPGATDANGFAAAIALRGMILSADHSGSAHAPALPRVQVQPDDVIVSRKIPWSKLHQHQRGVSADQEGAFEDDKALLWTKGSALLIAPTGSGKTEAALLWAACQQDDGYTPPRLFYTLPYQASMNAMVRRLSETFGKEYVEVQHGRALLATYRWLMEQGEQPENAGRTARLRRNLAQLHYPPIRVFSPYQMLKAMYRLKGYEAQLTDYHDGLFIFDEIHAYEINRLALILRTIAYLRRHYNARFLVMSATFPQLIREWLAQALGETPTIVAAPALYSEFCRHRVRLVKGEMFDEVNLARIWTAALIERKSVLVVCNVVARAQQVYDIMSEELAGAGIEIVLLHGRFNMRDRLQKERLIRERTGADKSGGEPIVLVATQAVEVSLDIDLDTIYTEPAPLEALIQRFGRVNRRGKKGIVDVHVFTVGSDQQKHIYDERLVAETLRVLAREDGCAIDESAVGEWLDEIYAGEIADEWKKQYATTAAEFDQAIVNSLRPFQSDRGIEEKFDRLFDGVEVLPEDMWPEYDELIQAGRFIDAGELLVPIGYRQLAWINSAGARTSEKGERLITVDVPYTAEKGLDMDALRTSKHDKEDPL